MQQPESTPLARIERQLERLDEFTRNLATKADLEALRKEVVQTVVLEAQLSLLKTQIAQLEKDRAEDKKTFEERFKEMETEQTTRADRLWIKLGPVIAGLAFLISLFEFLAHFKFTP